MRHALIAAGAITATALPQQHAGSLRARYAWKSRMTWSIGRRQIGHGFPLLSRVRAQATQHAWCPTPADRCTITALLVSAMQITQVWSSAASLHVPPLSEAIRGRQQASQRAAEPRLTRVQA